MGFVQEFPCGEILRTTIWSPTPSFSRSLAPSERGFQSRLFADLVSGDPIEYTVPLNRDDLASVGVDGMLAALTQEDEPVFCQVFDQVLSVDAHITSRRRLVPVNLRPTGSLFLPDDMQ
jgi:hypothetical protein